MQTKHLVQSQEKIEEDLSLLSKKNELVNLVNTIKSVNLDTVEAELNSVSMDNSKNERIIY